MPLGILVILAPNRQVAPEIFNRRRWMPDCFLPCVERLLQTIQVFSFQFRLGKCIPDIGVVWSDGENAPAQLDNRRFVGGVLGCLQLGSQLRNLLARAESSARGIQAQCQQEYKFNEADQGDGIMDTIDCTLQWLLLRPPIRVGRDAA